LERKSGDNINQFEGDDNRLVSNAFLYDVYARFEPKFDDVIQQQLSTPDKPAPLPSHEKKANNHDSIYKR